MEKKRNVFLLIFIFLSLILMAFYFPLTGKDLFWANYNFTSLREFSQVIEGKFLTNSFILICAKYKIVKIVFYSILSFIMFILLKNIINKKNNILLPLSIFLFFLIDKQVLASSYVYLSGFMNLFLSSVFLLLFFNFFMKNNINKIHPLLIFILGLIATLINELSTLFITIVSLIYYLFDKEKIRCKEWIFLLIGEVIGLTITLMNTKFLLTDFTYNLFYRFLPIAKQNNLIITTIFSGLVLLKAFKLLNKKPNIKVIFSVLAVCFYLINIFLDNSIYIFYISYFFSLLGVFYILYNLSTTRLVKRGSTTWLIFKFTYIILLLILGEINAGCLLFLTLLDILMILLLYNYLLPKNYLKIIWTLGIICMLSSNVYIYYRVAEKNKDMNFYIKNKLECTTEKVYLIPHKYKTDYYFHEIPYEKDELVWYIDFYNIHLNSTNDFKIIFSD